MIGNSGNSYDLHAIASSFVLGIELTEGHAPSEYTCKQLLKTFLLKNPCKSYNNSLKVANGLQRVKAPEPRLLGNTTLRRALA